MADERRAVDARNEQVVLGAMLKTRGARRRTIARAREADFVAPRHRMIFCALKEIDAKGLDYDRRTIATICGKEDFGGIPYLKQLEAIGHDELSNLDFHLVALRVNAMRERALDKELPDLIETIEDQESNREDILDALKALERRVQGSQVGITPGKDVLAKWRHEARRRQEDPTAAFRTTGCPVLDKILCEGFAPGKITVICGRPGAGKTTCVSDYLVRLKEQQPMPRVLVGAFESGDVSLIDLVIAGRTNIPVATLTKRAMEMSYEEREKTDQAAKELLSDDNITFLDRSFFRRLGDGKGRWFDRNAHAMDRLEESIASGDYDVVILDRFEQILSERRPEDISNALDRMEEIVQRQRVHVVILQQFSRKIEERKDKRPRLSDLKQSGGYEEDADLVIGLFREKYYKPVLEEDILEKIILKQRFGMPAGKVVGYDFVPGLGRLENPRLLSESVGDDGNGQKDDEKVESWDDRDK